MLTILSSPKPFVNEAAWNQLNALRSWRAIHPTVEIFIFGAPDGAAEAVAEVGAVLVPEIECSLSGAPSFNAMAAYANQFARHDLIVYVNGDILLDNSLSQSMESALRQFRHFLLVGERLDLAEGVKVDVRSGGWQSSLTALAQARQISAHGPTGIDYFGFVRGEWAELPPVFMGRAMCDLALLNYCFKQKRPIIDGTLTVRAIHQYHGYQHVAGGINQVFHGEDRAQMTRAHGLKQSLPTIADANWRMVRSAQIEPDRQRRRLFRRMELGVRYGWGLGRAAMLFRALQYIPRGKPKPVFIPTSTILQAWELIPSDPG